MALLDELFGSGAMTAADPKRGLLFDLLTQAQGGLPTNPAIQKIMAAQNPAPAPQADGWEPMISRVVDDKPMPGVPYAAPTAAPQSVTPSGGPAAAPTGAAGSNPFSPGIGDRLRAFGMALQGQNPGDIDKSAAVQNQTFDFLTRRGMSSADAKAVVSNPTLLQAALPAVFGGKTEHQVTEIYDAQGRKQKVLLNPRTGAYQPIGGALATKPSDNVSIGQQAVDKAFAKDYVEFSTGGFADAQKNLEQLRLVQRELTDPDGPNLTGAALGLVPDAIRAFTHPKSVDRRELVEEVVQRNLRLILGAQFTQREGDRLIARAYNDKLDEKTNSERLGRLMTAMDQALQAKLAASQYYEQHGTLAGFKGPTTFSASDMEAAIEGGASSSAGGGRVPDKSTALSEARKAIAAGKDPDAVRARLRQWGYELE